MGSARKLTGRYNVWGFASNNTRISDVYIRGEEHNMVMRTRIIIVFFLAVAAISFFIIGSLFENTLPGTWSSPCDFKGFEIPRSPIQIGDTMFFAETLHQTIQIYKSLDGCNWSEVDIPIFDDNQMWRSDVDLFEISENCLGMCWVDIEPNNIKPRSTFYKSTFDGSTWSEPTLLFQRDETCYSLIDVIIWDDGLLILWEEPLFRQGTFEERPISVSGCHVLYRAYLKNDKVFIEPMVEPENPCFCDMKGYSFINDGERIWGIFRCYNRKSAGYFRVLSKDGKTWNSPEPIQFPEINQIVVTPEGVLGGLSYDAHKRNIFLYTSKDWKHWTKQKLYRTEESTRYAIIVAGEYGMWGIIKIENKFLYVHPSQDLKEEYYENIFFIRILYYLSLGVGFLGILFGLLWIGKSWSN